MCDAVNGQKESTKTETKKDGDPSIGSSHDASTISAKAPEPSGGNCVFFECHLDLLCEGFGVDLLTLDDAPEPSNKYTEEQETQVQDHILRFRYVDTLVDHKAQRQALLRGFDYISLANNKRQCDEHVARHDVVHVRSAKVDSTHAKQSRLSSNCIHRHFMRGHMEDNEKNLKDALFVLLDAPRS